MKINLTNKIYFTLAILLLIGIGIKIYKYAAWSRYYYNALLQVQETDSIKIEAALLLTSDDFIPVAKQEQLTELTPFNLIPQQLIVEYTNRDKRYKEIIPVPADRIKEAFDQIRKSGKQLELYSEKGPKKGYSFLISQDKSNQITVWIKGDKIKSRLFSYTLKKQ
ncbi:hypothetical protein [Pedobacter montanisoli]|uniref:Uncharacterized protein n=1 Tax=Pedobacter montanisoli TaxID=2923277 RepID=A0ABS9ZSI6_9SPHI|nr:hypothetical protein [Pedobacter montanisoli]MCJ0741550.1 hypothetical protein [Pedobacter montanisoli]